MRHEKQDYRRNIRSDLRIVLEITSVAQTHVYCANAYNTLGDPTKSAGHLELAVRVDPRGAWGREAQRLTAEAMPAS